MNCIPFLPPIFWLPEGLLAIRALSFAEEAARFWLQLMGFNLLSATAEGSRIMCATILEYKEVMVRV